VATLELQLNTVKPRPIVPDWVKCWLL